MKIEIHVHQHADERVLVAVRNLERRIVMNQTDLLQALNAVGDELQKATAEIVAAVSNAGSTTPEVDAAVARLQAAAKALDDLNPDAPAPAPAPTEPV